MKKATKTKGASSLAIVPATEQDALMGVQLTAQYHRATGGAREVLIFGAMMMQLRERLLTPTVGVSLPKGVNAKDGGVTGWLEKFAPQVKRQSAQRFEAVCQAIETHFELPDTLARKISFPALVTQSEPELTKIDRRLPKKQKQVFEMAEGTSQKSWLDQIRKSRRGGDNTPRDANGKRIADPRRTKEQIARDEFEDDAFAACRDAAKALREMLTIQGPDKESAWVILSVADLEKLKLDLYDAYQGVKECQAKKKALKK